MLLLALAARGLGTCVEVSVAGYPDTVRAQLAIPAELSILCGLAVGYPDPDFAANRLHVKREPIEKNVVLLDKLIRGRARTDRGNDPDAVDRL
jgi:nitroreductase